MGFVVENKIRLVCWWGINDLDYPVTKNVNINGKKSQVWMCPYYTDWRGMLSRAHSDNYKTKNKTYSDVEVCSEWMHSSNFKNWVDSQPNKDWMNCELDKDLLLEGNKLYSPDTCVYVPKTINIFTTSRLYDRGLYMVGVSFDKEFGSFRAECSNPSNPKTGRFIGRFPTELEAHKAWQVKKHEYACQLADLQQDPRVAKALRERYAPDKDWTKK